LPTEQLIGAGRRTVEKGAALEKPRGRYVFLADIRERRCHRCRRGILAETNSVRAAAKIEWEGRGKF